MNLRSAISIIEIRNASFRWKAIAPPMATFDCDFEYGLCDGWKHEGMLTIQFELYQCITLPHIKNRG